MKNILKNKSCFIFDLDGVITSTADLHFDAWRKAALKVNVDIDESIEPKLRGVDRKSSLEIILNSGGVKLEEKEFNELLEFKNNLFIKSIDSISKDDLIDGVYELLVSLKEKGNMIALASTSKNAPRILEKLNIIELFDTIVDPTVIKNQKPSPDIFIKAAEQCGVSLEKCVVIEDAQAGVDGSVAAGIDVVAYEAESDDIVNATVKIKSIREMINYE